METIGLAIEGGAKLVVCPGFLFEEPIYMAQDKYPDVHFILLDGEPHEEELGHTTLVLLPHVPLLSAGEGGDWEMSEIFNS